MLTLFFGFAYSHYTRLNLNFVEVRDLNRILCSDVFVHMDGQLRAVHLILEYILSYKDFQSAGDTIKADSSLLYVY